MNLRRLVAVAPVVLGVAAVAAIVWRVDTNGWGSLVWLGMAIAVPVIRAPFAKANQENVVTERRAQGVERWLLAAVGLGAGAVPFLHLVTGVAAFADYDLPDWATAIGVVVAVVGLWLFWRSHVDLGRNWSVTLEVREEHTLVTGGVYRRVRHPMYSAIFVLYLATPLLVHNVIAGFAGLVAFGIMYIVRVPHEEAMMRDLFGDEYERYSQRTGRLVPTATRPDERLG
ncbi:MAG: protein-S-isoprenylcysteine O-methyltransferase [Actinomycetota bacterium]